MIGEDQYPAANSQQAGKISDLEFELIKTHPQNGDD